jgi:DNA mismatch repair ATPase MutS
MAATHDGELVDLLSSLYTAWHFGDTVSDDGLTFDHRLRPGHATTRNAIAMLKLRGAPEGLVRLASGTAMRLDRERAAPHIGQGGPDATQPSTGGSNRRDWNGLD